MCKTLVNHGIYYLSTGAGFLPSTVCQWGGPKIWRHTFFARSMALGTGDDEVDAADEIGS